MLLPPLQYPPGTRWSAPPAQVEDTRSPTSAKTAVRGAPPASASAGASIDALAPGTPRAGSESDRDSKSPSMYKGKSKDSSGVTSSRYSCSSRSTTPCLFMYSPDEPPTPNKTLRAPSPFDTHIQIHGGPHTFQGSLLSQAPAGWLRKGPSNATPASMRKPSPTATLP